MEHVGELIRHLRGRLGMTQADLAERAGLSPTTVVRLENGEIKRPRTNTLSKLSVALGLGPHELSHFMPRLGNFEPVEVGGVGPFTAVFQRDGDWWIGYVEELPGANAQGETLEDARENLREAVTLVLEANRELTRTEFENREVVRETLKA